MATSPQYANGINLGIAAVSATADVAVATAGSFITPTASSFVTLLTGGATGSRVDEIDIVPTGTTTACLIRLYIYNGTNYILRDVLPVTAWTNSTTVTPTVGTQILNAIYTNLELKTGQTLVVSCSVASQPINVVATGGDL